MVRIDPSNAAVVGLDLYTVAERHQAALVHAIREQIETWRSNPCFVSASVHQSIDGVRVFTYSQWQPAFDHRSLGRLAVFKEFFPPDAVQLEVTASESTVGDVDIAVGDRVTHLAEFRMQPVNQPEMVRRTTAEVERAVREAPGLLSATFHRSLDGTRMFNYGQWEGKDAFEAILKQPGFNPNEPYWEGLARNEFHLYHVVHVEAAR